MQSLQNTRRHGTILIYAIIGMVVFIAFASLAVDWGHAQLVKRQAQDATDAAAIYAASGMIGGTPASVRTRAIASVAENKINGGTVAILPSDVELGLWDPTNDTLVVLDAAHESGATAVRVTVHCSKARSNAMPLSFGSIIGISSIDITTVATATIGKVSEKTVPGLACPWLAGMPNGSSVANTGWNPTPTTAPQSSPTLFTTTAGTAFRFAAVSGNTTWPGAGWQNSGTGFANAEGDTNTLLTQNAANGINSTKAPLMGLMGIFLDNTAPNTSSMAAALDFSTAASRDFSTCSPTLKQVFFIGDGVNSTGTLQQFNAPTGATRLYIGFMDASGWWWDNQGGAQFTAVQGNTALLVE